LGLKWSSLRWRITLQAPQPFPVRRRVYRTGTTVGDKFAPRICVVSLEIHLDRMCRCLEDIRATPSEQRA